MFFRKTLVLALLVAISSFFSPSFAAAPEILVVVTSYSGEITPGHPTGYWAEELVVPCNIFLNNRIAIRIATQGGVTPSVDPVSLNSDMKKELASPKFIDLLSHPIALKDVDPGDFSGVFIVGGHGVLWDLVYNIDLDRIVNQMIVDKKKVVAAVCHGPAALVNIKNHQNESILKNKKVTGFSFSEEIGAGLLKIVANSPLQGQLATRLRFSSDGNYSCGPDWKSYVVVDGNLITGQNPSSSTAVAEEIVRLLK